MIIITKLFLDSLTVNFKVCHAINAFKPIKQQQWSLVNN